MPVAVRAALAVALLVPLAAAPPAPARVAAESAARPAKFTLERMRAPRAVRAGTTLRVRGRVANAPGRLAGTGRLTFSLRQRRPVRRVRRLRAKGTRADRNEGQNVTLTRGGRSRRFVVRLVIPRRLPARVYVLRGCVRRGSGVALASCRSRRLRVTRRRGSSARPPAPPAGGAPGGGGGAGSPAAGPIARRSLRAALTRESFYFVMADRFNNGSTGNDRGGLGGGPLETGFDPEHKGFYHGGDLVGLRGKLDYIKGLGTTAIWLTPSFKNKPVQGPPGQETAGYHGYWITDFTRIDPHLGTNQDLEDLVDAAHARGMKVFFDIITNHTADVITYEQKDGEPDPYAYVPKDESPYRTSAGAPFDDRDYAGTQTFPPLSAGKSFPFIPQNPPGSDDAEDVNHKVPDWLNDVTAYHNRGDTTFAGEDSQYGDFFGLDDLFTEQPRVVDGMTGIYKTWVRDFDIDGFRIDTMKHVNDEFWQQFAPAMVDYAHTQRRRDFFMFGEVFDTTKTFTSHFTTHDRVQAVLDFPFQEAARDFASKSLATSRLRDFFVGDDWYTDADSNAYQLPTFLGNHDMGHIGMFLRDDNGGAPESELLARDRLAHELMYFSRGNPVVYFGDEQGFTGAGNDQAARQDMFANDNDFYDNEDDPGLNGDDGAGKNDNIGSGETPVEDNFDAGHPLYGAISDLATLTRKEPALRDGPQQSRYSTDGPGIFAFSRLDRARGREYVVALNNSEQPRTAFIPTAAARAARFERIYGQGAPVSTTDAGRRLSVTVPALSTVVYRSSGPIPRSAAAPDITVQPLPEGGQARDRAEVRAFVDGDGFYDVTFEARVGDGPWAAIGTDDNEPYRVFDDIADLEPGTRVDYRATVLDNARHARTSDVGGLTVGAPAITMTAPGEGAKVRGDVRLAAEVTPDHNDNAVTFFRRIDDGDWTEVGTDSSQGAYTVVDHLPDTPEGTPVHYRAQLTYAPGRTVMSEPRTVTAAAPPVTTAVVHYNRPNGDYLDWGLHLWGDGKAGPDTAWDAPKQRDGTDGYGAFFTIPLADDTKPVNFIVHRPSGDSVPASREPGGDRSFVPADHAEIWLRQCDPAIYYSEPPKTPAPC